LSWFRNEVQNNGITNNEIACHQRGTLETKPFHKRKILKPEEENSIIINLYFLSLVEKLANQGQ
jgi:hypothetical protein